MLKNKQSSNLHSHDRSCQIVRIESYMAMVDFLPHLNPPLICTITVTISCHYTIIWKFRNYQLPSKIRLFSVTLTFHQLPSLEPVAFVFIDGIGLIGLVPNNIFELSLPLIKGTNGKTGCTRDPELSNLLKQAIIAGNGQTEFSIRYRAIVGQHLSRVRMQIFEHLRAVQSKISRGTVRSYSLAHRRALLIDVFQWLFSSGSRVHPVLPSASLI